jgi:hypothetical protein
LGVCGGFVGRSGDVSSVPGEAVGW